MGDDIDDDNDAYNVDADIGSDNNGGDDNGEGDDIDDDNDAYNGDDNISSDNYDSDDNGEGDDVDDDDDAYNGDDNVSNDYYDGDGDGNDGDISDANGDCDNVDDYHEGCTCNDECTYCISISAKRFKQNTYSTVELENIEERMLR